MPTAILSRIPVRSISEPRRTRTVTVRRDLMLATSCDCPAGLHSRACHHKRETQAKLDAIRAVKEMWPDCKIRRLEMRTCTTCQSLSVGVLALRQAPDGRPLGYATPEYCLKCGITRRYVL